MLVVRNSVSEDFIVPNTVLIYSAAIAGVAFNGIDNTALNLLNDAGMVGLSILRTR